MAELLDCPAEAAKLLNGSAKCIDCEAGQIAFRQDAECRGLYVVVAGQLVRSAERMKGRLNLGHVRAGELVELAAAWGDGHHTYTLRAIAPSTMLLLPKDDLAQAFEELPAAPNALA